MKKIYVLFLLFFVSQSGAIVVSDFTGKCGTYKYDNVYASFNPISYTCSNGQYLPANALGCESCPATGFTCPGGTFNFNANVDQGLIPNSYTCASGTFLPAAATTCASCPTGWTCAGGTFDFNRTEFQGLVKNSTYIAGNENNVCASNYASRIYAVFTPIQYTCQSGYFFPADSEACAPCPAGYTCPGGTFFYHKLQAQGLTRVDSAYTANETNACSSNFDHFLNASFTPNQYNCVAGQYLAANAIECSTCPENNLCAGGTYTFNETNNQGIETANCANGYSAPAGSATCTGNTINVRWDDGNGGILTTTCTYDGALTTPTTTPTAPRGYHFTGWSFPIPTYDFSTLDYTINGNSYTFDESAMTWATNFDYGDVSGKALCSVTPGSWATAGTPDTSTTGKTSNCWCKATRYTPANSGITYENTTSSAWVFRGDYGSASDCVSYCASICGDFVGRIADFRQALFGIQ